MRLAFGHASRVVLIGSSAGDHKRHRAITQQLTALQGLLVDEMRWGVAAANCTLLIDPARQNEVDLALKGAGEGVGGGLLLVYYVGPVLLSRSGALCLVLPGTEIQSIGETAVRYEQLRWRVRENGALHRVVVLDCYDVAATDDAGGAEAIAEAAVIERTSVLVKISPATGPGYPQFTAQLTALLDAGLPRGPNLLDLATIRRVLAERSGAAAVLRPEESAETIPLARNPALYRRDRLGQVLYAADTAAETDLAQCVILIVRYDKDLGALGLVLNRPGTEQARPLTSPGTATLSEPPVVFAGGPVLHEGYIQLALLGATATPPVRFFPVAGRLGTIAAPPAEDAVELLRLFRGYLGWGPGELEADLAAGVLVPTDAGFDEAFSSEPEELWHRLRATG